MFVQLIMYTTKILQTYLRMAIYYVMPCITINAWAIAERSFYRRHRVIDDGIL